MKKRVLTILVLLVSLVSNVQSKSNDGWYVGTKVGWSHFNLLKYKEAASLKSEHSTNAPIIGLFLGYEFNPYFGLEIENDTTGFSPHLIFHKSKDTMQANNLQILTKLSYPITNDFRVYTKLGGMMFWDNLVSKEDLKNIFSKNSLLFPSLSIGAEYILNNQFITRIDYTWKSSIDKIISLSKPTLGDTVISFGWKFGQSNIHDIFAAYSSETPSKQYVVLNENVNFPFNSSELKPIAYDKLRKIKNEIRNINSNSVYITLSGHADRIGDHEYNQKLSEDRAYRIRNYFTAHGISESKINIQGMGNDYPITDQICKDIKSRSLLINCLAPDRRVEIEISGNK